MVLTRRRLAARLKELRPDWPLELTRAAVEEIILALVEALAGGRPVVLNGFGRFEVRRYQGPRKRVGLVFRPGARLRARVQAVLAGLLFLAALASGPAWAQEEEDDFPFWIPELESDFQAPAPVPEPGPEPDPEGTIPRDPDLPALVLDPDPSPENIGPDPNEGAPGEGEVDLSAPGMTGSSGGTIPIILVEAAYLAHRKGDFQAAIDGYT
ncbi:MAG: hypothetical protein LBC90_03835, partial [Candidatus Adiutrix sp.]|nr:hypothetical protein [Candidatus Adiutrix sp.]